MRRFPFPHTMRVRLTLWNVSILALVLLALGCVLQAIIARNLLSTMDADLAARSLRHTEFWANVPQASHKPWPSLRGSHKGQKLGATPTEPVGPKTRWQIPVAERVFDRKGMQSFPNYQGKPPWDHAGFETARQGRSVYSFTWDAGVPLRVYSVPLRRKSGEIAGVVQLASSMEEVERGQRNLDKALLTLVPIALLAAGIGGMFLTGRMMRPLREVTRAAGQMGTQDLSRRLVVSGQDEFSELAVTFNEMLERLEISFEQQRRFTADASHELRTPLTVIKSVASRFLSRSDLPEEYRRGMERLDLATDVMGRVVQDLLLLARSDAGQLPLCLSPVPLSVVLAEAIACVELEDGPTFYNQASIQSFIVLGDVSHLTRLFSNLLDNAARHTPADGSITLSAQQQDERVLVTITDTGAGIPAEHLPHITERFYRADTARSRADGGTGLGLAICRSIVEAHKGTLHIESSPGQGTSITVVLPTAISAA